jgi:hypothetical protein
MCGYRQCVSVKHCSLSIAQNGITSHKTVIFTAIHGLGLTRIAFGKWSYCKFNDK